MVRPKLYQTPEEKRAAKQAARQRAKARNRAFVEGIRAKTVCVLCGAQPIDWHHESHPGKPTSRVGFLANSEVSIARIQGEIERCTPYCRSCHMEIDGRKEAFVQGRPYKKGGTYTEARLCEQCGKPYKPLRKGLCSKCNDKRRRPIGSRAKKKEDADG